MKKMAMFFASFLIILVSADAVSAKKPKWVGEGSLHSVTVTDAQNFSVTLVSMNVMNHHFQKSVIIKMKCKIFSLGEMISSNPPLPTTIILPPKAVTTLMRRMDSPGLNLQCSWIYK